MTSSSTPGRRIRVVIAEDEPPARRHLVALLSAEPDIDVIGACGDGASALELIEAEHPDLVFLDVQMPEMTGLEVADALQPDDRPAIIFVTAYSEHAVAAFELHAIDYLLKPFDAPRLRSAVQRVRQQLQTGATAVNALEDLVRNTRTAPGRLPVRDHARIHMLPLDDIEQIIADGPACHVRTADRTFTLKESIGAAERRLASWQFVRVHKSVIINTTRARDIELLERGECSIRMESGARVVTGRAYRSRVLRAFDI